MSRVARKKDEHQDKPSARSVTSLERECERLEDLCHALELRAESAEKAHIETIAAVSHDLRNQLSIILVSSRMLLRVIGADAPGRRQLDAILRAADDINQLTDDLVDIGSIDQRTLRVEREPHEVAPLVDQALEIAGPIAAAKPVELTSDVPAGLRPIFSDKKRIVQVLSTLIVGAVRFTPKGGRIAVRVEPTSQGGRPSARFSIADNGPGGPNDPEARPFSRYSQSRRPDQAIGLGPFVAKGIVEAHGGAIWIERRPGAGSTVYFTIPCAERPSDGLAATPPTTT